MTPPQKCSHSTASGRPCKAWAIRDTDPPTCSAHQGRSGAPAGNQNARSHGFYSRVIEEHELADLIALGDNISLDDEIALCRVAIRRLAASLQAETQDDDAPTNLEKIASLMFAGSRTVARLLRDKRVISGEAAATLAAAFSTALDEINELFPDIEI